MQAFRFENIALGIEDSQEGLSFIVGEVLEGNKMRVLNRFSNIYEAWKLITMHRGEIFLPKYLEKYL